VAVPTGALVFVLSMRLLEPSRGCATSRRLDVLGAVSVTAALMLAVYAINSHPGGWGSGTTIGLIAASVLLLGGFIAWEHRNAEPLMPLRLFAHRNLAVANAAGVLWAAAMFAWFFMSALYLQLVLGYSPLEVGVAFLPGNLILGALSIGILANVLIMFGYTLKITLLC